MIRFTGYGVIAEKPRVSHLAEFFRAPCRKNYALDRKMTGIFLPARCSKDHLENLDFADDIALLSHRFQQIQEKTTIAGDNSSRNWATD